MTTKLYSKEEKELLEKVARYARVCTQDNPAFSIIDAKMGYARSPTEEEIMFAKAFLLLYNW